MTSFSNHLASRAALSLLLVSSAVVATACSSKDSATRTPLSQNGAPPVGEAIDTATASQRADAQKLPLAAIAALDSGNAAYRAKKLEIALAKYRDAAAAAPQHAAPWFGIYMVANEMKNAALADSAMARVKAISNDPAALSAHSEVTANKPGLLPPPSSGTLPEGHPSTQPMPGGHPKYKLVDPKTVDSVKRTRM